MDLNFNAALQTAVAEIGAENIGDRAAFVASFRRTHARATWLADAGLNEHDLAVVRARFEKARATTDGPLNNT